MDGILVVNKPAGPTSHDVVALVRRLAATRRVGHGGTLDPFASGVLPVFLGRATRLVEYHLSDRKGYRATVCFGASSTTDDLDGELTPAAGPAPARDGVIAALDGFRGRIVQRPPAFSAVKVAGRRAYALARAGRQVEIAPREVEIDRLELTDWDDSDPTRPISVIDVECSAGTYVRAFARDLGEAVGSAAHLGALVRTRSGPFSVEDSVPIDDVRVAAGEGRDRLQALLLPIDYGLDEFPVVPLTDVEVDAVAHGQHILPSAPVGQITESHVRLMAPDGTLVGIGTPHGERIAPDKVFAKPETGTERLPLTADALLAAELDPPPEVDPDPATPDDV